jgi:hypothetical protein
MKLKLLEITNSKPFRPINISGLCIKAGFFCQPFCRKDKSKPYFVKRKGYSNQILFLHGDPHYDIHEGLEISKGCFLNSLLAAGYFCTACNKDPFAYLKSSSIIYTLTFWEK